MLDRKMMMFARLLGSDRTPSKTLERVLETGHENTP